VGLNLDDPVWDATVFTKNRDRLLEGEVAKEFLARGWSTREKRDGPRTNTSRWTARCWKVGQPEEFSAQGQEKLCSAGRSGWRAKAPANNEL
jgi:hypothetical protein